MEDEFLTVPEASRRSGYTRKTIYRWLDGGQLTKYTVGVRSVRVSAAELEKRSRPQPVKCSA